MRTVLSLRTTLALLLAAPLVPAYAANHLITAAANVFLPQQLSIDLGDTLEFVNPDVAPHNVVSDSVDRRSNPLFRSDTINTGQRAPVNGVDRLARGSYTFFCTIHPQMRGVLNVGTDTTGYVAVPTGAVVATPTAVTVHGDSLYVTSYATGDVVRLPLLAGGALGPPAVYASGFDDPLGLVFASDGTLFVADSREQGTGRVGRVRAIPPGGGAAGSVGAIVVDGLPNGRHATNNLAILGSRLYITNGNNTDDGVNGGPPEQPLSGTLLSVPLRARNLPPRAGRDLLVEARGMRNPYDVAFRPGTTEAWIPTNGPDELDPYGEDLLHMVDVRRSAADFGFPACVYRTTGDDLVAAQNPAVAKRCTPRHTRPKTSFGLHVSADGLAFAPSTGGWAGDLFVAEFGNNTGTPAGHKVVRVPIDAGHASRPVDVLYGATPLDLTFGPAGLYVADFGSGAITLVQPVG